MVDTHAVIRRFERFLSGFGGYYSNITEVRPDTKGALMDEIRNDPSYGRDRQQVNLDDAIPIAHIKYDFKNQTEKIFRYKSRGKK